MRWLSKHFRLSTRIPLARGPKISEVKRCRPRASADPSPYLIVDMNGPRDKRGMVEQFDAPTPFIPHSCFHLGASFGSL